MQTFLTKVCLRRVADRAHATAGLWGRVLGDTLWLGTRYEVSCVEVAGLPTPEIGPGALCIQSRGGARTPAGIAAPI